MPKINTEDYRVHPLMRNKHINTIYTSLFRKVDGVNYTREWFNTPDKDTFAVDRSLVGSSRAAIVVHGLESSTQRAYVKGAVKALNEMGIDAYAINLRSCSGEMNLTYQSYYSGQTTDLHQLVEHLSQLEQYTQIYLAGFSLGGNIVLRYVGEQSSNLPPKVTAAAAFSVPCDLRSSSITMAQFANRIYMSRFVKTIKQKMYYRMIHFPERGLDRKKVDSMRTFSDIDNLYTAPAHGFKDAEDYWARCSSKPLMKDIAIPTLLVNALDDPFLGPECQPHQEAELNPNLYFAASKHGGHMGFASDFKLKNRFWHERKMVEFFRQFI